MSLPPLLDELLRADGPSGYESHPSAIWRARAVEFGASVSMDRLGSSLARIGDSAPLLALVGHIDEIGLVVTDIDESGYLWFAPIGYWDPQVLVGQRVRVRGHSEVVSGVVGRKPIHLLQSSDELSKVVELKDLYIDIGVRNRSEAAACVRVGDPVVVAGSPQALRGRRVVAKAMDNRVGAYVALESMGRSTREQQTPGSVVAIASVQEEIGLLGAKTAAYEVKPDIAIAIDVWHASDVPDVDGRAVGTHPLGSGPIIGRGPTLSQRLSEMLIRTAESEGIPYSIAGYGFVGVGLSSGTDADALQISRSGITTGVVSVPLRYMHSPVEMVDLGDLENAVRLLAAFGSKLDMASLAEPPC